MACESAVRVDSFTRDVDGTMDRYVSHAPPPQVASDQGAVQCFWLTSGLMEHPVFGRSITAAAAAPLRPLSDPAMHPAACFALSCDPSRLAASLTSLSPSAASHVQCMPRSAE